MLQESQIQIALETSSKKAVITKAINHEEQIKFHSEIRIDRNTASRQSTVFLDYVSALLPADKYRLFVSLFRHPVKTLKVTDKIFDSLSKVFDGQNPIFKYDFVSPENLDDWLNYQKEELKEFDIWRTKGLETMKTAINSVVIVDLPAVQTSTLPEPYFYFQPVSTLIDYKCGEDQFDWIIYRINKEEIAVIDDVSYRVFFYQQGQDPKDMRLKSEAKHDLTYCPAKWFWSESINCSEPDIKRSPLSTHLRELDELLFKMISQKVLDLYAAYPIYSAYETDCDFQQDNEHGFFRCDRGFLRDQNNQYIIYGDNSGIAPCPVCSGRRLTGPGSYIEMPRPDGNTDMMKNPISITTVDVNSLNYNVAEVERLERNLYEEITGYGGEPVKDQAINEKQVRAAFEARTMILRDLKKNFEIIQQWVDKTQCLLRYGPTVFKSCSIDYGTDFYLYEADRIMLLYQEGQAADLNDTLLDLILDQYHQVKFRNNPDQLQQYEIEKNVKPYRHLTKAKAVELWQAGFIESTDLDYILNFPTFVARFEREQASLVEFGKNLMFSERINRIKNIMDKYAKRDKQPVNAGAIAAGNSQDRKEEAAA